MQDHLVLQVEEAGKKVQTELDLISWSCNALGKSPTGPTARAVAVYDSKNNGVWVKLQGHSGKILAVSSCSVATQAFTYNTPLWAGVSRC